MILFHVTDSTMSVTILETGLRPGAYLTSSEEVADYYAETLEEEGQVPVCLEIDLYELIAAVGEDAVTPDHPGIAEPITRAIGKSEDEVIAAWSACKGTWRWRSSAASGSERPSRQAWFRAGTACRPGPSPSTGRAWHTWRHSRVPTADWPLAPHQRVDRRGIQGGGPPHPSPPDVRAWWRIR